MISDKISNAFRFALRCPGAEKDGGRLGATAQGGNIGLGTARTNPVWLGLKAAPHWAWHASCGLARWRYFSTFRRVDRQAVRCISR